MSDLNSYTVSELYKMTKKAIDTKIHKYIDEWYIEILSSVEQGYFHTDLHIYNGDMNDEGPRLYLSTSIEKIKNLFPGMKVEHKRDDDTHFYQVSWDIDALKQYESSPQLTNTSVGTRCEADILRAKACLIQQYCDITKPVYS